MSSLRHHNFVKRAQNAQFTFHIFLKLSKSLKTHIPGMETGFFSLAEWMKWMKEKESNFLFSRYEFRGLGPN